MPGLRNTLREFAAGQLRSGSKDGPAVTNPKQAIAIGMNEAGKTKPAKGHHAKAKHHHAAAGKALEQGDVTAAMHHTGHLLSALRVASRSIVTPDEGEAEAEGSPAAPPTNSLRSRLSSAKK